MEIPEEIQKYRDRKWRREDILKVESPEDVEELIGDVGFCLGLTDSRTNLPSVYVAVCGRRDAHSPKNVQKDHEASLAWTLKDGVMRRGNVYYSKLAKGRATFVKRSLIPFFHSVYGVAVSDEEERLSPEAIKILVVLRKEWESSTAELREDAGIKDRKVFTKAIDELQRCMKVIPYEVLYKPRFTYLWTLAEERFPEELGEIVPREKAVLELARAFLRISGMTCPADLSKAVGISRVEAGAANQVLVDEGFAVRVEKGVYRLRNFPDQVQLLPAV